MPCSWLLTLGVTACSMLVFLLTGGFVITKQAVRTLLQHWRTRARRSPRATARPLRCAWCADPPLGGLGEHCAALCDLCTPTVQPQPTIYAAVQIYWISPIQYAQRAYMVSAAHPSACCAPCAGTSQMSGLTHWCCPDQRVHSHQVAALAIQHQPLVPLRL